MEGIISYSQCGQDVAVDRILKEKRGGIFVDLGAYDGIHFSNTARFELSRGWTGLCVEANPETFVDLQINRACDVANYAVGDRDELVDFTCGVGKHIDGLSVLSDRIGNAATARLLGPNPVLKHIKVPMKPTQMILDEFGITHIDYLSVDVEGCEREALAAIDWARTTVNIMTVENNHADPEIRRFISGLGFHFIGGCAWDDVYLSKRNSL